jgi:hypothetical protein
MANVDRPNGFSLGQSQLGAPLNAMIRKYEAADRSADTTGNHGDIYVGDPVKLVSGKVLPANSGDTILGVAVAVGVDATTFGDTGYFDSNNLTKRYLAYDEDGVVAVIPAEGNLFEVQSASDLDLVVGANADITLAAATAHGSRVTSRSSVELTTDSNSDVIVTDILTTPDNDGSLANARYLVKFVTTTFAL